MKSQSRFVKTMALGLGLLLAPASASAQLSVHASVSLATPYVWRGLTRANGWNFAPEAFVAAGLVGGYLTAGGWANLEADADSPGNLSDLGEGRPGFSEVDYWLQYTRPLGEIEATIGAIRYTYPGDPPTATRTSGDNTTEIYGALQMTSTYLVPRLAAYMDVDRVRGVYLEGSVTVPLLASPFGNPAVLYASGVAGYNLGQELNPDRPTQRANFRHDGFTHFDFSLRATIRPIKALPLSFNLEPHWQLKVDEFTQRTSPEPGDAERHIQFWLGLSVSTGVTLIPGGKP
jgi:hypothetical protein